MSTLQTSEQHKQEEQQPGRIRPRYAYDALWQSDIARCERGELPVLGARCRCNGELFGVRRGNDFAFFASLLADDPHSFRIPIHTSVRVSLLVKPASKGRVR